jgi:hypothetical protein
MAPLKSAGYTPYYGGQSQHQSILDESMNPANLAKYNDVLNEPGHGTPVMLILPMQTPTGRYASQTDGFLPAVQFLEKWLIPAALKKNLDLVNNHETRMLKKVQVKGILNADPGGVFGAASELRQALDLRSRPR